MVSQISYFQLIFRILPQAIMKSYTTTSADSAKPEKFLAYMAPSPDEVLYAFN